jgi:hypothetical protein
VPAYRREADGRRWVRAQPVPPTRLLHLERWLQSHRLTGLARVLARWDERGLARR